MKLVKWDPWKVKDEQHIKFHLSRTKKEKDSIFKQYINWTEKKIFHNKPPGRIECIKVDTLLLEWGQEILTVTLHACEIHCNLVKIDEFTKTGQQLSNNLWRTRAWLRRTTQSDFNRGGATNVEEIWSFLAQLNYLWGKVSRFKWFQTSEDKWQFSFFFHCAVNLIGYGECKKYRSISLYFQSQSQQLGADINIPYTKEALRLHLAYKSFQNIKLLDNDPAMQWEVSWNSC